MTNGIAGLPNADSLHHSGVTKLTDAQFPVKELKQRQKRGTLREKCVNRQRKWTELTIGFLKSLGLIQRIKNGWQAVRVFIKESSDWRNCPHNVGTRFFVSVVCWRNSKSKIMQMKNQQKSLFLNCIYDLNASVPHSPLAGVNIPGVSFLEWR